jgi:phosphoribosylformimino-5-aminoimidazole carboxamide ribonucleotide (ProFAR) isomerase
VTFDVIPAIDVSHGRLAVFGPQGPRPVDAFEGSPLAAASAYAGMGARWIHIVDLDRAFGGDPGTVDLVTEIRGRHPDIGIQASGGIRSADDADRYRTAGAARIVLSSAALADQASVAEMLGGRSGDIVVGIEVAGGVIRPRGADEVALPLAETLGWLTAAGADAYLVTAVDRVSTLTGPDTAVVRRVARAGRPVIAAGGITSIEDLRAVREAGAVAAVVGRAALEDELDLAVALAELG